ncbi:hypothetical protein A2U01_0023018, partial [Trifolium medium]|nr:hypothetical protein [Trifolium medium]
MDLNATKVCTRSDQPSLRAGCGKSIGVSVEASARRNVAGDGGRS